MSTRRIIDRLKPDFAADLMACWTGTPDIDLAAFLAVFKRRKINALRHERGTDALMAEICMIGYGAAPTPQMIGA